ncbi:ABC transporter substrate-binding protein [Atribacter laminatus]|uniref:Putative arabinose-binding protein n=1 Tax=Atribacter laminatus TaxID=2847778 RepID=A0A7T1F2Y0_ATRLM|nr:sugar ABC transporter substrate-binding protein [Atribacter laminatus]QPM68160.1 putative arabinose-binding protein [Atribacter laminatus]
MTRKNNNRMNIMLILTMLFCVLILSMFAFAEDVEIVTLNAGTSEVEQKWGFQYVEEWNKNNPQMKVRYELVPWPDLHTKVMAYIAAGTPPDMAWYFMDQINEWHKMGVLEPLDEWLGDSKNEYLDALVNPGSDAYFDGKVYGAPFSLVASGLAVRRDLLEEKGLSPESIKTWDDFKNAVKVLTDPPNRYGTMIILGEPRMTSLDLGWWAVSNGLGSISDFNPEKKKNYIELLQFVVDLSPYMAPAQIGWIHRDSMTSFAQGLVGMYATASYFYGEIHPISADVMSEEKTVFIPLPYGPSMKSHSTPMYTVGYVMFKDAPHKKEAAEFLKYWVSDDVSKAFPMNLSPKKNVTIDDRTSALGEDVRWFENQWNKIIRETNGVGLKPVVPAEEIYRIFNEEIIKLFKGETTPEEAYDYLKANIEPLLLD